MAVEFKSTMAAKETNGYPTNIFDVELKNRFMCEICRNVMKDPHQSSDGELYCKACFPTGKKFYPDRAISKEIANLPVHCKNKVSGCPWFGKLCEFENHIKEKCLFGLQECPNCDIQMLQKDLLEHLTICTPKSTEIPEVMVTTKDQNEQDSNVYSTECCDFHVIGCEEKNLKEESKSNHMKSAIVFHQTLLLHYIVAMEEKVSSVLAASAVDTSEEPTMKDEAMSYVQQAVKDVKTSVANLVTRIEENETAVNICRQEISSLKSLKAGLTDKHVLERAWERIQVLEDGLVASDASATERNALLRDIDAKASKDTSRLQSLESSINDLFTSLRDLKESKSPDYLSGNMPMVVTQAPCVVPELPSIIYPNPGSVDYNVSYDGSLLWKLNNFTDLRANAIQGKCTSMYSPPFFTGPRGYKVCGRVFPNGDGSGKGTHLSVFIAILRGPYDALLPWPLSGKVRLTLIDQANTAHHVEEFMPDPMSQSFFRPISMVNKASGSPQFFPLNDLFKHEYLRDDVLYLKIDLPQKSVW